MISKNVIRVGDCWDRLRQYAFERKHPPEAVYISFIDELDKMIEITKENVADYKDLIVVGRQHDQLDDYVHYIVQPRYVVQPKIKRSK